MYYLLLLLLLLFPVQGNQIGCGVSNPSDPAACTNGQGVCAGNPLIWNYCICKPGYTGPYCQSKTQSYTECDCGVRFEAEDGVYLPHSSAKGLILVSDITGLSTPIVGSTGIIPLGHPQQGQYLAYLDAFIDGFVYDGVSQKGYFVQFDSTITTVLSALPNVNSLSLFTIDRNSLNLCPSLILDVTYYWNQNALVIGAFCSATRATSANNLPNCVDTTYWSQRHWRYFGHKQRLSPNSGCQLTPIVYNPQTYCEYARCLSVDSALTRPCYANGLLRGYCLPVDPNNPTNPNLGSPISLAIRNQYGITALHTGHQCYCKTFENRDNGTPGLIGTPLFLGLACELPIVGNCVPSNSKVICGGHPSACQSSKAWNGEFFLDDLGGFATDLNSTYIPKCNCNGLDVTGQFCTDSRCSNPLNPSTSGCNSRYAGAGQCLRQSANGVWGCTCAQDTAGTFCEVDGSHCVYPDNGFRCTGGARGVCLVSAGGNTTQCSCNSPYFGTWCENSDCTSDVMSPGHGVCINGQIQSCYKPYTGTRCEYDNCFHSGGTVTGSQFPTTCDCPSPLQVQYDTSGTPSCWPQCASINGSICGIVDSRVSQGLQHTCLQFQSTTTGQRFAECQCAPGHIFELDPISQTMICVPYCKNGGTIPPNWSAAQPTSCICPRSTGFDTGNGANPRCDNPICSNGGTFNSTGCICKKPWRSEYDCKVNTCGTGNSVIPWFDFSLGQLNPMADQCSCAMPFAPQDLSHPFDCLGNMCQPFGIHNTNWDSSKPVRQHCLCLGLSRTTCTTNPITQEVQCSFCHDSFCSNGGYLTDSPYTCTCPFPWTGTTCQNNLCNQTGNSIGIDYEQQRCLCTEGYEGTYCVASLLPPPPPPPPSFSSSSSTGESELIITTTKQGVTTQQTVVLIGLGVIFIGLAGFTWLYFFKLR